MELRHERVAGLRRAAPSRLGLAALVAGLYLAAGVVATWPAVEHSGSSFLAAGAQGHGEAAPGDHLQSNYRLWLVGHQLERGTAPWLDPYTFQPEVDPLPNFAGWPFGLPYWPLHALFGDVGGWNAFVLLTYVLAGVFAFLWLRALPLPLGGALAGGLAFALAPYRVEQSAGHLLGPVSVLLPLALWAIERGRRGPGASREYACLALAVAATASVALSGQVHLALGTTPFVLAYALLRVRERRAVVAACAAVALAAGAALLYRQAVIAGSTEAGGRSLPEVAHYSAQWQDFLARTERHGRESFVFLGWATPLAAVAGAALLARARRFGLLVLLGIAVAVPVLLALGTNLPLYGTLWRHVAPLRFPRVPERLMPIACLGLAALVGVAVGRLRNSALVALALVALVADLRVHAYTATAAGPGRSAYAALAGAPAGRLLELPVFLPGVDDGSVYLYFDMQARRERPLGYALGPASTDALARRLKGIGCGDWAGAAGLLGRLGVRYVAVHGGLYPPGSGEKWFAWRGLLAHGFGPLARDGAVTLFGPGGTAPAGAPPEPSHGRVIRCDGWRDGVLRVPPGELWAYGGATLALRLAASAPVQLFLDGRPLVRLAGERTLEVPLTPGRWHVVRVEKRGHGPVRLVSANRT